MLSRPHKNFYHQATLEIQAGMRDEGLYARCYAKSQGNEAKALACYLDERAEELSIIATKAERIRQTKLTSQSKSIKRPKPKARRTGFGWAMYWIYRMVLIPVFILVLATAVISTLAK